MIGLFLPYRSERLQAKMLDFLRKRKRNWVIVFFLGVIVVTFALFVGSGKFRDQAAVGVAEINGEIISQQEFTVAYERAVERYRQILKGSLTPEMIKGLNLKGNLLEELIQKKLVLQEAHNLGLTATDDDLAVYITHAPEFQVGGRFSNERNKESLKEPLKIQLEYLSYPFEQFTSSSQVSEKEIEDYYQSHRDDKFHNPKEAKVRYISIPLAPGADANQKKAAQARADGIVKEARGGKDFSQLAK